MRTISENVVQLTQLIAAAMCDYDDKEVWRELVSAEWIAMELDRQGVRVSPPPNTHTA